MSGCVVHDTRITVAPKRAASLATVGAAMTRKRSRRRSPCTGDVLDRTAHVLVNAGGIPNSWQFPPIPGIDSFKGLLVHSAAWPKEGLELEGKTVGLIGNGSSGIQILPAIKDKVGKLVTFIREATWVAPPLGGITSTRKVKSSSFPKTKRHNLICAGRLRLLPTVCLTSSTVVPSINKKCASTWKVSCDSGPRIRSLRRC